MPNLIRSYLPVLSLFLASFFISSYMDWDDVLWNHLTKWRNSEDTSMLKSHWVLDSPVKQLSPTRGELSGLTWSDNTKTLFSVRNKPAAILELDTDGTLLREITTSGLQDPEAIVWLGGNQFVVADERTQTLYTLTITPDTQEISTENAPSLSLSIELNGNKGFEGLAYDHSKKQLYVAKEREPQRLYVIENFTGANTSELNIKRLDHWQGRSNFFMDDFSGLQHLEDNGNLLVLSDESALIAELNPQGEVVAFMELDTGFSGLSNSIPQAEGLTIDSQGTLYVVSEPDFFYRFKRAQH